MRYSKSPYSLNELNNFRDDEGFINLDRACIEITKGSSEPVGMSERIKFWVDFNGHSALIKGEVKSLSGEDNYGMYAELITEEVCKAAGLPSAHYDLVKITDKDGNTVKGVLSENIVSDKSKVTMEESLVTLRAVVGSRKDEDPLTDTTEYMPMMEQLRERLDKKNGPAEKNKTEKMISDFKKRLLFDNCILATDNHLENYGFLAYRKQPHRVSLSKDDILISIAPSYDREASFMLDMDKTTIESLLDSPETLFDVIQSNPSRIICSEADEEYPENEPWKGLFKELIKDPEIAKFYDKIKNIDIEHCLDRVEDRINAILPDDVRDMAMYSFLYRQKAIEKEFAKDLEKARETIPKKTRAKATTQNKNEIGED